jgi:LacI family transcriptional regulator
MCAETPSRGTVTLRDIAERCGVSKSTVAQALGQNVVGLSADTVARVRAVARAMGYNPSHHEMARRLALRKGRQRIANRLVAFFLPPNFHRLTFFTMPLQGVMEVLTAARFGVCVGQVVGPDEFGAMLPFPEIVSRGDLDAVIITSSGLPDTLRDELRANPGFGDKPIVNLYLPHPLCASVGVDYRAATFQAADHLLRLGHRHLQQTIYFYDDDGQPQNAEHVAGARDAFRAHGLDPDTHLHLRPFVAAWTNPETALGMLSALDDDRAADAADEAFVADLRAHPEITGIIAVNDADALHMWYALHKAGLSVPDDISLVGMDDTDPMRNAVGENLLTTVRLPLLEIGREAGRYLLRRIAGDESGDRDFTLPTELVVRRSTAPPRR